MARPESFFELQPQPHIKEGANAQHVVAEIVISRSRHSTRYTAVTPLGTQPSLHSVHSRHSTRYTAVTLLQPSLERVSCLFALNPRPAIMSTAGSDISTSDSAAQSHTCSTSESPPTTVPQKLLEVGASTIQSLTPIKQIHAHLCALHAYAAEPERQVVAHHYCTHLTSEIHQCVLYDSADKGARLIGIEYLISRRLFDTLPAEEKPYWHSHKFEVESGMLQMPGLPELMERPLMHEIAAMYGKIVCTWQSDIHSLPIGPPQIMVSLTQPQQVNSDRLAEQERQTGIKVEDRRKQREGKVEIKMDKPAEVDAIERGDRIVVESRLVKASEVRQEREVESKQ